MYIFYLLIYLFIFLMFCKHLPLLHYEIVITFIKLTASSVSKVTIYAFTSTAPSDRSIAKSLCIREVVSVQRIHDMMYSVHQAELNTNGIESEMSFASADGLHVFTLPTFCLPSSMC